jgi:CDP-paratose 2-epimerase
MKDNPILVSGGAGFVGAHLSIHLAQRGYPVVALDNLCRTGSEGNVARLADAGVRFVMGDVRDPNVYDVIGKVSCIVDACALPSVLEGMQSSVRPVIETNLNGTLLQLEHAVRWEAKLMLLSTSRVLPVDGLASIPLQMTEQRVELQAGDLPDGCSLRGISEAFPVHPGHRTFYGTSKLAAEMLVAEFVAFKGLRALINRCGVLAGPGQFGRIDQGVMMYWLQAHRDGIPLEYLGFDGSGRQVRDFLHVADLAKLIANQIQAPDSAWNGNLFHVGGGLQNSLSLRELTAICQRITGRKTAVKAAEFAPRPGDIPWLVMDSSQAQSTFQWAPQADAEQIAIDAFNSLNNNG